MRIVATSDTHFPFDNSLIPDGDVLIHAGDFMYTGYESEWYPRLESFAALPHKVKILVPGNHDAHVSIYPGPTYQEMRKAGVTLLGTHWQSNKIKLENGTTVLGVPFVTNLPNWSFNRTEEEIDAYMEKHGRANVIVSHSPPRAILDRATDGTGGHWGVAAFRKYLARFQPEHWICGHVHEHYGTTEVEGCKFYNVAMCDENYKQVNPAMVIDL